MNPHAPRNCVTLAYLSTISAASGIKRCTSRLLTAALALCVLALPGMAWAEEASAGEGGITLFSGLVSLDGKPLSNGVSVGSGKWTLVKIWVTNCPICQQQSKTISAFHDQHSNIDAVVVGIAMDGPSSLAAVQHYIERYEVTFPNVVGDMMHVMKQYEKLTKQPFRGTPTYLLFSPVGEFKGSKSGPITIAVLERFIQRHKPGR
ncbi:MAG: TlpA family protein disulfide reductase [Granulosicoccus sp.]